MKSRKSNLLWATLNLCRLILALTFIFSGTVKLIDPKGFEYKLEDYAAHFSLSALLPTPLVPLTLAVVVAMVEFLLGVYLFFGIRRRLTATVTLAFMIVVTPLTLYIALTNAVVDCGCFGDALTLSNWQTFGKNALLLACAILVVWRPRSMTRFISEHNQWTISVYSLVFALVLALYSIHRLPPIDFRPYRVGTDLATAIRQELQSMPDKPKYADFCIDTDEEGDITLPWLDMPGYKFLLVAPYIEEADDSSVDDINDIYDYCRQYAYPFLCLTSSGGEAIERWKDMTGAEYPFAFTDGVELKTVIRSNPGLLLLEGGVILRKWPASAFPSPAKLTAPLQELRASQPSKRSTLRGSLALLLWFFLPLIAFALVDRAWAGGAYLLSRRLKRRQAPTQATGNDNHTPNTKPTNNMRKKIVAGNWKMNLTLQEGVALATELKQTLEGDKPNCEVVICTPFIHLATIAPLIEGSHVHLGAENCADKEKGAYTGEVSAQQVKSTGAQYVILGHSERRAYYNETPETLKQKLNLALANGLTVIFCIGEVLEEREAGKQNEVVAAQLADSLFDLEPSQLAGLVLAYEPVWAIGTGKTATAEQAQEMHAFIRGVMAGRFGDKPAEELTILYGGSCKPSNAKELFSKPDVDGGLIGGASLKCADFKGIIDAWK